jgi:hypothetical protein
MLLLLSRRSTTTERLHSFHRTMMRYKTVVFRATGFVTAAVGLLVLM